MYISQIIIVSHSNPRCIFFTVCIFCVFSLISIMHINWTVSRNKITIRCINIFLTFYQNVSHTYINAMIVSMSTILEVVMSSEHSPVRKSISNISARIWNVLSNKINCDVSMSIFKCNLKLFLLNNELVLNYPK